MPSSTTSWPKQRTLLTAEQESIFADWNDNYLGSVLPQQFGWVDRFGHEFAARAAFQGAVTLEIGAGNGSQLPFERGLNAEYIALDHSDALAGQIAERDGAARVVVGDCQDQLDFPDGHFDRVLAIHVLEHLDNLPVALGEIQRVLKPSGTFSVIIPCEGGIGYSLGRRLTTKRIFEKRYQTDYEWMIGYDHCNNAHEILRELPKQFSVTTRRFFPLGVPVVDLNLVIGLELTPR